MTFLFDITVANETYSETCIRNFGARIEICVEICVTVNVWVIDVLELRPRGLTLLLSRGDYLPVRKNILYSLGSLSSHVGRFYKT